MGVGSHWGGFLLVLVSSRGAWNWKLENDVGVCVDIERYSEPSARSGKFLLSFRQYALKNLTPMIDRLFYPTSLGRRQTTAQPNPSPIDNFEQLQT